MPHCRYLTFSLRTLFVLTATVAVWLGVIAKRAREQREAVKAIEALGGTAVYDWQDPTFKAGTIEVCSVCTGKGPPGPAWLRRLIGDEFFQEVLAVHFEAPWGSKPDALAAIPHLTRLRELKLVKIITHDADESVEGLPRLKNKLTTSLPHCEVSLDAYVSWGCCP